MDVIRVLVIEDEGLFREMVVTVLAADPEIEVVGSAATGLDAINLARALGRRRGGQGHRAGE